MPPGKLESSILLALGVAASGCGDKDTDTGPCLEYADTGDTGDTGVGPCLSPEADDGPSPTSSNPETSAARTAEDGSRGDARARVLDRGVLPEDVARLLRSRKD